MAQRLTFSLGNIVLTKFEVPEKFDIGHELMMAEHKLISESGAPVVKVHTQGAFPLPTTWNATLFGANALSRAEQLDRLCTAQQEVLWVYGPLQYNCIIKRFKATPAGGQFELQYEIELVVLENRNGAVYAQDYIVPFDVGVQQFYSNGQAAIQAAAAADAEFPLVCIDAATQVDTLLSEFFPLNVQPLVNLLTVLGSLDTLLSELDSYVNPLMSTAVLEADMAKLNASLQALGNYGLMRQNLAQLAGAGPYVRTIPQYMGNLFDLASIYYPEVDPTDVAPSIATANNLEDFFINTPTDIHLPPVFS
jgi:hypothetical protein